MRSFLSSSVLLVFASAVLSGQRAPAPQPPAIAFGTNVGHWLSQAKLDRAEMATFFTEGDVVGIKRWGMDHIRVPVDSPLIASEADRARFNDEGLSWIDRAVAWTRNAGLTLVLDMHHLPGHGFMSESTNTIWAEGPDRRQAIELWKTLARRYSGQPHVVFELLNEPVAPVGQDELWHALARDLLAAVRSVNQENWIMIGSNRWSNVSTFAVLPKFDDARIIYTFHFYDPFLFTHQRASWAPPDIRALKAPVPYPGPLARTVLHTDWLVKEYGWMTERAYGTAYVRERLAPVLRFRDIHHVPVYCGEFGVLDTAPLSDRYNWYRDVVSVFRIESIGFANWNYKSDGFGLVNREGVADVRLVQTLGAGGEPVIESTLETFDVATGRRRSVYTAPQRFEAPNWSRDGRQFLFNQGGGLYTIPVSGGAPTRLDTGTVDGCNNDHGYSPDGRWIALSCGPAGESRVYVMPAGGGEPRLVAGQSPSYWHGWSPDGTTLAFVGRRNDEFDIYTVPAGGGPERRLTTAPGLDDGPDYTPDGRWIYFNSDRTGAMRLWRMRGDGSDQQQVTDDAAYGDWFPHPSPDSRWIVFLSFDAAVEGHPPDKDVVLRLLPGDGSGPPRVIARLFGGQGTINVPSWSPDGRQFAFVSYRRVSAE
jgi:TolB protein